jgi:hypothetical protein
MSSLIDTFGRSFLSYVLNSPAEQLDDLAANESQAEVLRVLLQYNSALARESNEHQREVLMFRLISYTAEHDTSVARSMRRLSGAAGTDMPDGLDDLEQALVKLSLDLFPDRLLPRSSDYSLRDSMAIPQFSYPQFASVCRMILADSDLTKLFPGHSADDLPERADLSWTTNKTSEVHWSTGSGGTLQLTNVAPAILKFAFGRHETHDPASEESLCIHVLESLRLARRLARGERVQSVSLVGFSNLTICKPVDLPWGRIRQPAQSDRSSLMVQDQLTCTLEIFTQLEMFSIQPWPREENEEQARREHMRRHNKNKRMLRAGYDELSRDIDLARFAILLASRDGAVLSPNWVATSTLNPLAIGGSASMSPTRFPIGPFPAQEISYDVGVLVQDMATRTRRMPASLDLGMRRLLNATTTRSDPVDGFVDAVICWENLFGTNEGESTFRICAAMAALLYPEDLQKREAVYRELQALYRARSKIVHGSKEPSIEAAQNDRNRAVHLAVEAFRQVINRADLLAAADSALRGRLLVLGV